MFLQILAHHSKNRVIKFLFNRSGETVSRYFNLVLNGILRLHEILLKAPKPVPEDCVDERWKFFKCLGALDGTHIQVNVPALDKPRYRNRKGDISTNVLGAYSRDMQFIYVLPGWEGSASNSRVLRDAISRRNGLIVPTGYYYLVDAGYTNCEGFLAPYRGCRYHRSEWRRGYTPSNKEELFNMRYSMARNVIEWTFGLLKMRWAILRSRSFYPIKIQIRIINACCLLHNFIRREMPTDPMEEQLGIDMEAQIHSEDMTNAPPISTIEGSDAWSTWRENLATET
ncbi:protein ALP1-like [Vicia villosa]|uniref:protein ALP1-like n=1 Tax=Vicia villosa TaxID=3911 RepID=UPI00273BFFB8|nr:protein ALP1-like [Vicia villosa]